MTIGQVARQAGLSVETIRFYERRGLIPEPQRTPAGYRKYSLNVLGRIRFIKQARELDFSLNEIAELLTLREGSGGACARVEEMAKRKMVDLDAQLRKTRAALDTLEHLSKECAASGCDDSCGFLAALESAN